MCIEDTPLIKIKSIQKHRQPQFNLNVNACVVKGVQISSESPTHLSIKL